MAKLELEFPAYNETLKTLTVNGKRPKLKKNKSGNHTCVFETQENIAQLSVYKSHYYFGKAWGLWWFIFYIVSIFGIFDIIEDKKCLVVDCKFNIDLNNNTKAILKPVKFEDGGKFIEIECDSTVEELSNIQYRDKNAQKIQKRMKKVKIFLTLFIILCAILGFVFIK